MGLTNFLISYLGTDLSLTLSGIDVITDEIKCLGKAHLFKIDISHAFHHIKVDLMDYDLLGLWWQDAFVNTCAPFGSHHGSQTSRV